MTFVDYCRAHGVLIDSPPPIGVWRRFKTEDKPSHRNGAVKFMGDHGFVQNHATMQEVAVWKADEASKVAQQEVSRIAKEAQEQTLRAQAQAVQKAREIFADTQLAFHPYIAAKGFPEEAVNVQKTDAGLICVIPMFVGRDLVGCQRIHEDGTKKFLFGQRSSGAEFVFFNGGGMHVLCEGYATALSVRRALKALKVRYTLHVTFSAGNMKRIASTLKVGVVIADNDASGTGERVAKEIGWPYWMSDRVGEDANDYHQRRGVFALSQGLRQAMRGVAMA